MAGILDGKGIAAKIKEELKEEIQQWKDRGIQPCLAVILAGEDPASVYYAKAKQKVCESLGMTYRFINLPGDVGEEDILGKINELNGDKTVHGIMVELPLPKHIDTKKVTAAILPEKDVDGVHPMNRGAIMSGDEGLFPATPQSCIELLLRSGVEIEGKHVVIVGRGETVGKPLVFMILKHHATVSICHSRTRDLSSFTRQGDIVIAAVGKPKLIKADMVKPGAVVVDAGINETNEGMCGDVDYEGVKEIAGLISPVPGGVGSLTTTLLLKNVLKGLAIQLKK
ncbi:MAG: bifunctional 5,10-methylenetetrahydrofolate dehydrogenase/5,10-methenyltetrahydrofolate cyclohydrolase [Peptococcaceae bacterium]|nr:bifunctional 5,10-methylenetetrahydrofolate dehydrogenase/5,10-methenyltetrahydrofolate cyclohydrolase [Peptococcaceae bacterium]